MSLRDDSSLCCEVALRLLGEYDRADRQWIDTVRVKIDAAVAMSEHTPTIDGETFIAGICDFRFWIDSTDKSGGLYHQEILGQEICDRHSPFSARRVMLE